MIITDMPSRSHRLIHIPRRHAQTAFSAIMAFTMSGLMSAALTALNTGINAGLAARWLHAWAAAFAMALPLILIFAPRIRALVARLTD